MSSVADFSDRTASVRSPFATASKRSRPNIVNQDRAKAQTMNADSSLVKIMLKDGLGIVVPDSLNLITTYVLYEQQDWFEDELDFLRQLILPGQKAIDIGANYGLYTMVLADRAGPDGRVWAFEPATQTAQILKQSIEENGFRQVVLDQRGVSGEVGKAFLALNANSELNYIHRGGAQGPNGEWVQVSTLDECARAYDWNGIEFVKIDAEGEESNIIAGGKGFFAAHSPLVQYEIKAGPKLNLNLVREFSDIGYSSYRLVPGIGALAPFSPSDEPDGYLLNLFCCKPDRADDLAGRGFLVRSSTATGNHDGPPGSLSSDAEAQKRYWSFLSHLPYAEFLNGHWSRDAANHDPDLKKAFRSYAISIDRNRPIGERFAALKSSFHCLKKLCDANPSFMRLMTLARVAGEYGARSVAVAALRHLVNRMIADQRCDLGEPFLMPSARFESNRPRDFNSDIGRWVLAAALEELEKREYFSSYYSGASTLDRLKTIKGLGFGDAEIDRRLELVHRRFGKPADSPAAS